MIEVLFSHNAVWVHLASSLYVIGFWIRDQLLLRSMVLLGTIFYIIYYYYAAEIPLWNAILWSGILGVVNLYVTVLTCPPWWSARNVSAGGGFLPRAVWRSAAEPGRPRPGRWFRVPAVGTQASYGDDERCNAVAIARSRSWLRLAYRRSPCSRARL